MTFNSTQNYRSAKLGVEAALQDLDLGKASFSGSMQVGLASCNPDCTCKTSWGTRGPYTSCTPAP